MAAAAVEARPALCFLYRDKGDCAYGSQCHFLHPGKPTAASVRKATQLCFALRDEGSCRFGDACRYSHDRKLLGIEVDKSPISEQSSASRSSDEQPFQEARRRRRGKKGKQAEDGAHNGKSEKASPRSAPVVHRVPPQRDTPLAKQALVDGKKPPAAPSPGQVTILKKDSNKVHPTLSAPIVSPKPANVAPPDVGRLECRQFKIMGSCYRGADCRFLHDGPKGSATVGSHIRTSLLCFEIAEKGRCSYGSECRYSHDLKLAAVGARQQLDRSDRSDRVCYNWEDEGRCAWGDHCRFLHASG